MDEWEKIPNISRVVRRAEGRLARYRQRVFGKTSKSHDVLYFSVLLLSGLVWWFGGPGVVLNLPSAGTRGLDPPGV